ncbi:hypothetical protein E3N88_13213 [Mikania micrantha]|uniref:Uncharacterized protein n=1 Tax=Mikania micrantha TaxID=192012 RepID=A0A5N6P9N8_9ASTR|nr:hypothetical protein E3N88_13213 [Mikania micrantha]
MSGGTLVPFEGPLAPLFALEVRHTHGRLADKYRESKKNGRIGLKDLMDGMSLGMLADRASCQSNSSCASEGKFRAMKRKVLILLAHPWQINPEKAREEFCDVSKKNGGTGVKDFWDGMGLGMLANRAGLVGWITGKNGIGLKHWLENLLKPGCEKGDRRGRDRSGKDLRGGIYLEKEREEFPDVSNKNGGTKVKDFMDGMSLGMLSGELKLGKLLDTPPPGLDETIGLLNCIMFGVLDVTGGTLVHVEGPFAPVFALEINPEKATEEFCDVSKKNGGTGVKDFWDGMVFVADFLDASIGRILKASLTKENDAVKRLLVNPILPLDSECKFCAMKRKINLEKEREEFRDVSKKSGGTKLKDFMDGMSLGMLAVMDTDPTVSNTAILSSKDYIFVQKVVFVHYMMCQQGNTLRFLSLLDFLDASIGKILKINLKKEREEFRDVSKKNGGTEVKDFMDGMSLGMLAGELKLGEFLDTPGLDKAIGLLQYLRTGKKKVALISVTAPAGTAPDFDEMVSDSKNALYAYRESKTDNAQIKTQYQQPMLVTEWRLHVAKWAGQEMGQNRNQRCTSSPILMGHHFGMNIHETLSSYKGTFVREYNWQKIKTRNKAVNTDSLLNNKEQEK